MTVCRALLLLLKNPTFAFLCLAGATEATLIAGMSTFGPKFLESQFGLSASEAATWFGGWRPASGEQSEPVRLTPSPLPSQATWWFRQEAAEPSWAATW